MTFIAGFFSFSIELNNADRGAFAKFRTKLPRHELESTTHFYARIVAYLHAYTQELSFSQDFSDIKQPTLWCRDTVGSVLSWIHVGVPEKRKLELSLKQNQEAEHRVYCYTPDDIPRFCHHLRGSKSNWIRAVQFFSIEESLLSSLEEHESSSSEWVVSCIDDRIYITVDDQTIEADLSPIDMWSEFQSSLANESPLEG